MQALSGYRKTALCAEIFEGLNSDGRGEVKYNSIKNALLSSCKKGKIKQVGEGVYAHTELDNLDRFEFPPIKTTTRPRIIKTQEQVIRLLDDAKKPLRVQEIVENLNNGSYGELEYSNIPYVLSKSLRERKIVRISHGIYAHPDSDVAIKSQIRYRRFTQNYRTKGLSSLHRSRR